ncbi:hypothetical protein J1N35_028772 [Gossypium stocksii]|uniref:Prolamin-like domain-containing protein n=1 Tax=Gossypium stocksii TaxID=47602 RepID=A0A9D3UX06_9ROSI|nr:hypothetical protein J1N35_028772 [Gossypium stocksii]
MNRRRERNSKGKKRLTSTYSNSKNKRGMLRKKREIDSTMRTWSISNKCCSELVLGKVCHSALVKRTLENPLFKDLNPVTILAKSIETRPNCLALIDSPSPSA